MLSCSLCHYPYLSCFLNNSNQKYHFFLSFYSFLLPVPILRSLFIYFHSNKRSEVLRLPISRATVVDPLAVDASPWSHNTLQIYFPLIWSSAWFSWKWRKPTLRMLACYHPFISFRRITGVSEIVHQSWIGPSCLQVCYKSFPVLHYCFFFLLCLSWNWKGLQI